MAISTSSVWAAEPGLRDWAAFDKAYIPALALSTQGDAEGSRKAMQGLTERWQAFSTAYAAARPSDPQWGRDFGAVGERIAKASALVADATKLGAVHEVLEGVRTTFATLRGRNGIDYYVDYLTRFHEPMEEIVLSVKDRTVASLTDAEVAEVRRVLGEAEAVWDKAQKAGFDPAVFAFPAGKAAEREKLAAAETAALAALRTALAGGDKGTIVKAAAAIKPPYSKLFMLFGDFGPARAK
jgi:hypothetical protein